MNDWQTWIALAIVALSLILLIRGAVRSRGQSCGSGCACPSKKAPQKEKAGSLLPRSRRVMDIRNSGD